MADQDNTPEQDEEELNPKKRGLGRGLGALFEDEEGVYPMADSEGHTPGIRRVLLGIDQLQPGRYQPRKYIDKQAISELAESIAIHGVLQPLIVRALDDIADSYEIVAGERRWRAAQEAQLHEVPVILMDLGDEAALEIGLIENLQRQDLNILEEAQGYQLLMDEFDMTQERAALKVGKSRSHVANSVRLLTLPDSVKTMIKQGALTAGHARALVNADNPEELAKSIVEQGLSVREIEKVAGERSKTKKKKKQNKPAKDVDTLALEDEVSNALGMRVSIDVTGAGGTGTLKINFKTLDQLDELLHRLSHNPSKKQIFHMDE